MAQHQMNHESGDVFICGFHMFILVCTNIHEIHYLVSNDEDYRVECDTDLKNWYQNITGIIENDAR